MICPWKYVWGTMQKGGAVCGFGPKKNKIFARINVLVCFCGLRAEYACITMFLEHNK